MFLSPQGYTKEIHLLGPGRRSRGCPISPGDPTTKVSALLALLATHHTSGLPSHYVEPGLLIIALVDMNWLKLI